MPRTGLFLLLLAALAATACSSESAGLSRGDVWAEVNGQPIYRAQVERNFERETRVLPEPLTPSEEQARKLNILSDLIQEEILWQAALQAGIRATDAEIEQRLQQMRADITADELNRQLDADGGSVADIREELRRDIAIRKLFDRTLQPSLQVSDKEIQQYYEQYRSRFRTIEAEFHAAQILVTPRRDDETRNLRNDDAASEEQARAKVQLLMERLRAGDDFAELARAYSEDPTTALAGGDLGFFPESALQGSHPALRAALEKLDVGQVGGPVRTPDGYIMIKLLERVPPGQRDLSEPAVQESIRDMLLNQKRQLVEQAFAERLRNRARVANYLAREILESNRVAP